MNRSLEAICLGIIIGLCIFIEYKVIMLQKKVDNLTQITDTVYITDTITNWQSDTVYFNHYDTINTTDVVIINDTVNDTTYIQVPIYTYVYDSVINDSLYKTDLRVVLSGYKVSMDTLMLNTQIKPQKVQITTKKWYQRLCPAVGIGFGTGGFGVFGGIGYEL